MSTIAERLAELGDVFEAQAAEADELGRLPEETAKLLRSTGVVRMLQPRDFGGLETSPVDFFKAVLAIGRRSPSAGWVASVVGIHPFEFAQADRRVQEEVWGTDPDTWTASPYAPMGRATPVEGGYRFSGRWSFSSGTDHCDWIILGGLTVGEDGKPDGTGEKHFILPRSDYEIIADSWQVVGLKGTGSKDIVIEDAFVPSYRVIDPDDLESRRAARAAGRADTALYRMPFHVMFGSAIACGTLAIAEGLLREFTEYTRRRVTARGMVAAADPATLGVLGAASADIASSTRDFLASIERLWELAQAGGLIPVLVRAEVRRDQVNAVRRAIDAADRVMNLAGGSAMRLDNPLQKFWRDLHIAGGHAANVADKTYQAYGAALFTGELPKGARL